MERQSKQDTFNVNWPVLTDESLMPYGQHKDKRMIDVPAKDLLWLYDNNRCSKSVLAYVIDNWDVLCKQAKRAPKNMPHANTARKITRRL